MITISLCMIVKNEEDTIARCLDSVKEIADEIIIVDTGSTDLTKKKVSLYTDRIYDFTWIDDFAAARNYSFSHATKDYILWLDADDQLFEKDRRKLLKLKKTLDPALDSVSMKYHVLLDQQENPVASCRRNRLVKRINNYKWFGAVHEYLFLGSDAKIYYSDAAVSHNRVHQNKQRNLNIYEKLIAKGQQFSPRDMFHYGDELVENGFYEKAIEQYLRFLDEKWPGLEDNIAVCGKMAQCYHQLGNLEKELQYLLKALEYDLPNAESCCRIGNHFFMKKRWNVAIFWFSLALQLKQPEDSWGLIRLEFHTWLPHIQLAICYGKLGMLDQAYHHNEIAYSYLPNDPAILNNKQILEKHLYNQEQGEQV
jgi:glycosyltransferase involved in cell wall biosynthesis